MNLRLVVIILALLGLVGGLFLADNSLKPSTSQSNALVPSQPISQDDPVALKQLIQRLVSPSFLSATPTEQIGVYLGKLPEALPVVLPIPQGAKIVGSVLVPNTTMIAEVDVPQNKADVFAFYKDQLQSTGWQAQVDPRNVTLAASQRTFCLKEKQLTLQVTAATKEPSATDVRLTLFMDPKFVGCGPLVQSEESDSMATDFSDLNLLASERSISQSGGGSPYDHSVTLIFETDLKAQAVLDDFAKQLKTKGWQPLESGAGASLHWSTWQYQDPKKQTWHGVLDLFQSPENSSRYFLTVHGVLMTKGD
jgi:hypothetical protein